MKKIDMTKGNLYKNILIYFIPIALASMLQIFYTSADVIVVGKFAGTTSLAAVGAATPLVNLLVNLFIGLSVGSSVTFARLIGERKEDEANKVVSVSFIISLVAGLFLMIVGIPFSKIFLKWMDTPDDCIDKAATYMRIYFAGIIFNIMYNYLSSIVRSNGDSTTPLIILAVTGIINIGLNLVLVIFVHMDVAGVAIATIFSQILSVIIIIIFMSREKGALHFSIKNITFDKEIFKEIMKIGIPAGIQSTLFAVSNVIIQSTINSYGSVAVAGNSASQSLESFVYVISNSLSQVAMNFASQNYGARNTKYIKKSTLICMLYGTIVSFVVPIIVFTCSKTLLTIYTDDPLVIDAAYTRMIYHFLPFITWVVVDIFGGANRGLKKAIAPMVIMLLGVCVFRFFWIYLIYPISPSLKMIYLSYPTSWIITGLSLVLLYIYSYKEVKIKFDKEKTN